ncbi:MAG TPA: hypothetical protein VKA10_02280 [Prolixibacteraceae bacterium]|nr:hypothetical protein [Prolixibacteraceae bacterium]
MKKLIIFLLITISATVKADIIYSPYTNNHLTASFEWIYSYEFPFFKHNTIAPWGGLGIVSSTMTGFNPSLGTEVGFELRHYFKANEFEGFNIGLYGGFACMLNYKIMHAKIIHEFNSLGLVPGIKFTYKHFTTMKRLFEPYLSISNPFNKRFMKDYAIRNMGYMLTVGIRLGINRVKKNNYVT